MHEHLADKEYINKTQSAVNFLTHVFSEDVGLMASIMTAQAESNTERLIDLLGIVKGRCEDWIEELKKEK